MGYHGKMWKSQLAATPSGPLPVEGSGATGQEAKTVRYSYSKTEAGIPDQIAVPTAEIPIRSSPSNAGHAKWISGVSVTD